MLDIRSFMYDIKTGRIVQERVKNMPVMEGDLISVVTHVSITRDVRKDLLVTAREGFAFIDANID